MTAFISNHPIRVLVVDGESDFRSALVKGLAGCEVEVRGAAGPLEAMKILEQSPMDVVICEAETPEISGLMLLDRIKSGHPDTEVILIADRVGASDGVDGIRAGAFDYLPKSIDTACLAGRIKQAYERIRQRKEQDHKAAWQVGMARRLAASERLAALFTLASGLAHEINNPLAIISESTGWLKQRAVKDPFLSPEWKETIGKALSKIEIGVDRTRRITHQLLDLARHNDYRIQEFDLVRLLEEVLELTKDVARHTDVTVKGVNKTGPLMIWSDPQQLRQVLLHLVTNGIQAVDRGGVVGLRVIEAGCHIILEVEDNGEGIPPENLDRIFEPFAGGRPAGQGVGLGLSVSRGIVENLGGRIEVKSRLGAGTVFKVILPRRFEGREPLDATSEPKSGEPGYAGFMDRGGKWNGKNTY